MASGLRDAVYGAAVGDALGVPCEFLERDTFMCTGMASGGYHGQPAGTFSDDTSMMLATCDSIRVCGRSAIPAEWLEALRGKEIIESCLFSA